MAESPPPIPARPAGFWWRSLAFLADALPLAALAVALAERTAGEAARVGMAASDAWVRQLIDTYIRVAKGADPALLTKLLLAVPDSVGDWIEHLGLVGMLTFTAVLGLQEALLGGRTLGKMMVNLRVIDVRTGQPPGVAGCLLRAAWKGAFLWFPSPLVGLVALVSFHLPLFRKDNRSIHDLATFTQVIDGRAAR